MRGVVDEQHPNPRAFGSEQIGVGGENVERRADQLRGTQRRNRGLRCGCADRGPQQHDLLVLLSESAGRDPLRLPVQPPDALQFDRIDVPLRAAGHQVAEFGCETGRRQRRAQFPRPAVSPVVEISGEQFTDDAVLLGTGDQPGWRIAGPFGGFAKHGERVGVHRTNQRLTDDRSARLTGTGSQQTGCERTAGVLGRPAGTREDQDGLRVTAVGDMGDRGVDKPGGLTCPGTAQHPHRRHDTYDTRGV